MSQLRWTDTLQPPDSWINSWERMYLGKFHKTGQFLDGLGGPDYRYLMGIWRYNPLELSSSGLLSADPPSHREIVLSDYLETGLDFYVYLSVSSLSVTYERIKSEDRFALFLPCPELSVEPLQCRVIEPTESRVPGLLSERLKIHQWSRRTGGWGATLINVVDLPIFLRVKPEELTRLYDVLENKPMKVFTVGLEHNWPMRNSLQRREYQGIEYVEVIPSDERLSHAITQFFSVRREKAKEVNILVASDIHVAERADVIESEGIGKPNSIEDPYCNFNEQARGLKRDALEHWRNGRIDYAIFCGDLIDHAWRDSIPAEVNLYPGRGFRERRKPYAMGEFFYYLDLLATDFDPDDEDPGWWESVVGFFSDDPPVGRAILQDSSDPANLARVREILLRLRSGEDITNWPVFRDTFGDMFKCVTTFLVPGNHGRLIFGSELHGIEKDDFKRFIRLILEDFDENSENDILDFFRALDWLGCGYFDLSMKVVKWQAEGEIPDYDPMATFGSTGLSEAQAKDYDTGVSPISNQPHRKIRSRSFRTLLGSFQSENALAGISSVGGRLPTGGSTLSLGEGVGSYEIPMVRRDGQERVVRLAFFDNGPNWNLVKDSTPWVRGFPEKHKAIERFVRWRDGAGHSTETLICFMHAPPVSLFGPHGGPVSHRKATFQEVKKGPKVFHHGWHPLFQAMLPFIPTGAHTDDIKRPRPLLIFAGHTHWRHTYSILRLEGRIPFAQSEVHFEFGNRLLESGDLENPTGLNDISDPDLGDSVQNAYQWWFEPSDLNPNYEPGTGRVLVVQTGCVGPIPAHDYDEHYDRIPVEEFTHLSSSQGYYIVTIEEGVVTKIKWHKMPYRALD